MKLADVAKLGNDSIPLSSLASDKGLAREVQTRLAVAGLLDPPSDGKFGAVSSWALQEFCKARGLAFDQALTAPVASALLGDDVAATFLLQPGNDFAGRIVKALQKRGDWICRHPACFNIVYVEGANPDGTKNDNKPNEFNDVRILLQTDKNGTCKIVKAWEGTTEPGRQFTMNPLDPKGAARIAFGQYKAWSVGTHHPGQKGAHAALVQVEDIHIFRDLNKDFKREGDKEFTGVFAINQHWGYDAPKNDLKNTSAGCLVGRTKDGHREFMKLVKSDPRFKANNGYRFMTSVFPVGDVG
jgi:hypothetical protein